MSFCCYMICMYYHVGILLFFIFIFCWCIVIDCHVGLWVCDVILLLYDSATSMYALSCWYIIIFFYCFFCWCIVTLLVPQVCMFCHGGILVYCYRVRGYSYCILVYCYIVSAAGVYVLSWWYIAIWCYSIDYHGGILVYCSWWYIGVLFMVVYWCIVALSIRQVAGL